MVERRKKGVSVHVSGWHSSKKLASFELLPCSWTVMDRPNHQIFMPLWPNDIEASWFCFKVCNCIHVITMSVRYKKHSWDVNAAYFLTSCTRVAAFSLNWLGFYIIIVFIFFLFIYIFFCSYSSWRKGCWGLSCLMCYLLLLLMCAGLRLRVMTCMCAICSSQLATSHYIYKFTKFSLCRPLSFHGGRINLVNPSLNWALTSFFLGDATMVGTG